MTEFVYIKSKSKEKILKSLENLTPEDKFKKSIENNVIWLYELCLSDGFDPSFDDNWALRYSSFNKNYKLFELLMSDERTDLNCDDGIILSWAKLNKNKRLLNIVKKVNSLQNIEDGK